jgi:hypothetical protein
MLLTQICVYLSPNICFVTKFCLRYYYLMLLSNVTATITVTSHDKHAHCHQRGVSGQFADGGDGLQIWRV